MPTIPSPDAIALQKKDFVYSTPSYKERAPLRLLKFKSFATDTTLSLSLVDAKKDDEFFAISYAWDRPVCEPCFGVNGEISCPAHVTASWTNNKALCNNYLSYLRNGTDGYMDILIDGKNFFVQDTVYHLLLTIRKRLQEGTYFWLDAICINQNDKTERQQQASDMDSIYKAAQHVYVWLGTADDSSDAAMDFLISQSTWLKLHEYGPDYVPHSSRHGHSHTQDVSREIYDLFDRPYWKRTWVIQEYLLARDMTLLCGNRAVSWTKAENLVDRLNVNVAFLKQNPLWSITPGVKLIKARKAFRSYPMKLALENMIYHFIFSRSTHLEDNLIGLIKVSLSNAGTVFKGEPGSTEKRVEVINEVVRDIRSQGMGSPQSKKEWAHLLACLLGVPDEFPKPAMMSPFGSHFERGSDAPLSPRRLAPAATAATYACAVRVVPRPVSQRIYSTTSIPIPVVGSVRSSPPVAIRSRNYLTARDTISRLPELSPDNGYEYGYSHPQNRMFHPNMHPAK